MSETNKKSENDEKKLKKLDDSLSSTTLEDDKEGDLEKKKNTKRKKKKHSSVKNESMRSNTRSSQSDVVGEGEEVWKKKKPNFSEVNTKRRRGSRIEQLVDDTGDEIKKEGENDDKKLKIKVEKMDKEDKKESKSDVTEEKEEMRRGSKGETTMLEGEKEEQKRRKSNDSLLDENQKKKLSKSESKNTEEIDKKGKSKMDDKQKIKGEKGDDKKKGSKSENKPIQDFENQKKKSSKSETKNSEDNDKKGKSKHDKSKDKEVRIEFERILREKNTNEEKIQFYLSTLGIGVMKGQIRDYMEAKEKDELSGKVDKNGSKKSKSSNINLNDPVVLISSIENPTKSVVKKIKIEIQTNKTFLDTFIENNGYPKLVKSITNIEKIRSKSEDEIFFTQGNAVAYY